MRALALTTILATGLAAGLVLTPSGDSRAGAWEDFKKAWDDARMHKPVPPQIEQGLELIDREHYTDAMTVLEPMARLEDREALYQTAKMYELNQGLQAQALDEYDRMVEAALRYQAASRMGHADAAYRLGTLFARGVGVAYDPIAAARLYRQAAVKDHGKAQFEFATMLASGTGVTRDEYAALTWYLIAAERNDIAAAEQAAEALCVRLRRKLDLALELRQRVERPSERFRTRYLKPAPVDQYDILPARIKAAMDRAIDFQPEEGGRVYQVSMPTWRCFSGTPES